MKKKQTEKSMTSFHIRTHTDKQPASQPANSLEVPSKRKPHAHKHHTHTFIPMHTVSNCLSRSRFSCVHALSLTPFQFTHIFFCLVQSHIDSFVYRIDCFFVSLLLNDLRSSFFSMLYLLLLLFCRRHCRCL